MDATNTAQRAKGDSGMSVIEFKNVSPDDPAAINEVREHLKLIGEKSAQSAEVVERAARDVQAIIEKSEEQRVQTSDLMVELRKQLSTAPARNTDDADEDAVRRMVDGVRMDEELVKEAKGLKQGQFALIAQSVTDLRAKGANESTAQELTELQRLNDIILIESKRQAMTDPGGYMSRGGMKSLPHWKRYESLALKYARALNETNATEGLNWVPTILSGNLKRLIQVEQRLANFFPTVTMTSKTLENVVEGADFYATYIAEGTGDTTGTGTIDAAQFTTPKATWTARKLGARVVTTREIEADAVVDMVAEVLYKIAKAIRRSKESWIVNGQRTAALDTTLTIAANDRRKAGDGFRYHHSLMGLASADMGAGITAESVLGLTAQMSPEGKAYGLDPSERIFVTSPVGYVRLLTLKGSAGNAVVLTQDVAGAANTFQRGQLGEMFGSALVVSEFVSQQMSAAGLVTSPAGTKTALYCVNTAAYAFAERLGITLDASSHVLFEVDKMMYRGVYRGDFQPYFTPSSSDPFVAAGFNIG